MGDSGSSALFSYLVGLFSQYWFCFSGDPGGRTPLKVSLHDSFSSFWVVISFVVVCETHRQTGLPSPHLLSVIDIPLLDALLTQITTV